MIADLRQLETFVALPMVRKRVVEQIDRANNPQGISLHDGTTRIQASDAAYLLKVIDALSQHNDLRQLLADLDTALADWAVIHSGQGTEAECELAYQRMQSHGGTLAYITYLRGRIKEAMGDI